jgi:hypothetical protein
MLGVVVVITDSALPFSGANTFSNTVDIPEIIANTIKDVYTIKFKSEIIISLIYRIIYYLFF